MRLFLDAGHGGSDPGVVYGGTRESDLALAYTLQLARVMGEMFPGVEVRQTRLSDQSVTLQQRSDAANAFKADAFVSVHFNSGSATARGFQVIHARPSTPGRKLAEAIYRQAIPIVGAQARNLVTSDQTIHVGFTTAANATYEQLVRQNPTWNWSQLVTEVERQHGGHLAYRSLHVLRRTVMPAVLLEIDFLSNAESRARVLDPTYRERLISAIAKGTGEWFGLVPTQPIIPSVPSAPPAPPEGALEWLEAVVAYYRDKR